MSTLWRRLRAAWMTLTGTGAAASVAFGLLVFVSVLASLAIPRESTSLRTGALRQTIAAAPLSDKSVLGAIGLTETFSQQSGPQIAALGARLRKQLAADGLPVASDPPGWSGLTSGYAPVTGAALRPGRAKPQFEVTYRSALARYSHLVAGRLPSTGTGQVDGVVTTATAARFGLRPGARLTMGPVQLVITGVIRPVDAGSAFWTGDPAAIRPELIQRSTSQPAHWAGAVFIGAGGLATVETSLNTSEMLLIWEVPAALGRLTADQASTVSTGIGSLVAQGFVISGGTRIPAGDQTCPTVCPNTSPPVTMTVNSQIPAVLTPFITADNAVAPVLALLYVSLAVMGAVVVLLGARLVAQRRAAEFTLMRARGAALRQLAWLVLRPSAVIAVLAGAAAAVLAISLTPGQASRLGWWLAGLTIMVTLVGPVLISVLPQRVAAPATGRPVRRASGRARAARRIVLEAALVAASIGGLVVLRNQGLSAGNMALFPSAAPVLVAIPVAIIVLRCYPPVARALARIAGRSRGVAAFVGLARATRTPPGAGLPAFALVLVLSMVAFAAMISTSVTRGQVAQSWRQVGADAVIEAPNGQTFPPGLQRQIAALPGVSATAAGVGYGATLTATGGELTTVFVSPAQYAAVTDQAPGARFPLAALSGTGLGNAGSGGVPAVATAGTAELVGAQPAQISLGNQTMTIKVTGRISGVPGIGATNVALLPVAALGPPPRPTPSLMLVDGSGLDAARLRADVSRELPGGTVTLRSAALAAITAAPVPRAAQVALAQGMAAAAGFGTLVLLLSLVLSARTRDMTLARLATMGMRRWQAQLVLAAETLPQVAAAAVGGIACAWLLVPLVGPSVNLAAFTQAGPGVAVVSAPGPLVASAIGLVLAALLVLAAQAVVTYRRGSARALRIDDGS
jgi:putative ABC transport system permease protein